MKHQKNSMFESISYHRVTEIANACFQRVFLLHFLASHIADSLQVCWENDVTQEASDLRWLSFSEVGYGRMLKEMLLL